MERPQPTVPQVVAEVDRLSLVQPDHWLLREVAVVAHGSATAAALSRAQRVPTVLVPLEVPEELRETVVPAREIRILKAGAAAEVFLAQVEMVLGRSLGSGAIRFQRQVTRPEEPEALPLAVAAEAEVPPRLAAEAAVATAAEAEAALVLAAVAAHSSWLAARSMSRRYSLRMVTGPSPSVRRRSLLRPCPRRC